MKKKKKVRSRKFFVFHEDAKINLFFWCVQTTKIQDLWYSIFCTNQTLRPSPRKFPDHGPPKVPSNKSHNTVAQHKIAQQNGEIQHARRLSHTCHRVPPLPSLSDPSNYPLPPPTPPSIHLHSPQQRSTFSSPLVPPLAPSLRFSLTSTAPGPPLPSSCPQIPNHPTNATPVLGHHNNNTVRCMDHLPTDTLPSFITFFLRSPHSPCSIQKKTTRTAHCVASLWVFIQIVEREKFNSDMA